MRHQSSQGGESGTVYASCYGSSMEKQGKNTLSFHTAVSEIYPDQSEHEDE